MWHCWLGNVTGTLWCQRWDSEWRIIIAAFTSSQVWGSGDIGKRVHVNDVNHRAGDTGLVLKKENITKWEKRTRDLIKIVNGWTLSVQLDFTTKKVENQQVLVIICVTKSEWMCTHSRPTSLHQTLWPHRTTLSCLTILSCWRKRILEMCQHYWLFKLLQIAYKMHFAKKYDFVKFVLG